MSEDMHWLAQWAGQNVSYVERFRTVYIRRKGLCAVLRKVICPHTDADISI